jgi:ABC-type amino acid transport substrate-binding protein
VYNSKNTVHLFQQLLLGNIDIALTNQVDGELTIKQNNLLGIKLINRSLAKLDLFHYIHKNHKNLVKPINETIKKLKANGELAKMLAQAEEIILK